MNTENNKLIDCSDIYAEEVEQTIKRLKRFREAWLSSSDYSPELFQYADPDFYFYRFAIDRQENNTNFFLKTVLCRVMERYGIPFEVTSNMHDSPFDFIISGEEGRIGYRFDDFNCNENVNAIVKANNIKEVVILRPFKSGAPDKWISRYNELYKKEGLKQKVISLEAFFNKHFSTVEYGTFVSFVEQYLLEAKEITGYKSIKFLSSMNLATQKVFEEKELAEWDYCNKSFQIIDDNNEKVRNYLYLADNPFDLSILQTMEENYLSGGLYKALIGRNEFAESFITSEWLYHSLKGKPNFDYTSIISGYLKSIEQLLYAIVMFNVDNGCKITLSSAESVIADAISKNVVIYKRRRGPNKWMVVPTSDESKGYKYIDLISTQINYMDKSIGTFEYFLRNNPHIFVDPTKYKAIADMVCCFRTECRNGYFHTHNLKDESIVEKTRSNAIYLYYVLLGGCIIPEEKKKDLGISSEDWFDELCKKIREFRHYGGNFIFEYDDGRRLNLVFDRLNNTVEYTEDGIEHYEKLLFLKVEDFSMAAYEKLDAGISEEQKVYLTRDSLPARIFGVHRDKRLQEITF